MASRCFASPHSRPYTTTDGKGVAGGMESAVRDLYPFWVQVYNDDMQRESLLCG